MDLTRPLRVVTPTLDGDVLSLLASGEVRLTGREIQRRVGASQDGVRRAVERLAEQGVVTRERAGNANLYALNRRHLAAPHIEALAALRLELVSRLRQTISGWEKPPVAASLFGSTVRGKADAASDIDILVVRPRDVDPDHVVWRSQLMSIETQTFEWTGNDTRVLEFGAHELARGAPDPVIDAAAREGTDLYGALRRLVRAH